MCLFTNYARKIVKTFSLNQQLTHVLIICSKYKFILVVIMGGYLNN